MHSLKAKLSLPSLRISKKASRDLSAPSQEDAPGSEATSSQGKVKGPGKVRRMMSSIGLGRSARPTEEVPPLPAGPSTSKSTKAVSGLPGMEIPSHFGGRLEHVPAATDSAAVRQPSKADMTALRDRMANDRDHMLREPRNSDGWRNITPYLKTMVADYSERNPQMRVHYAKNLPDMFNIIRQNKDDIGENPIHIVTTHKGHHTAWRVQSHDGNIVALGLNSTGHESKDMMDAEIDFNRYSQRHPGLVKAGMLIPTGVQRDDTSCGVYTMGFLQTFAKNPGHFNGLSNDVLEASRRVPPAPPVVSEWDPVPAQPQDLQIPSNPLQLSTAHALKDTQRKRIVGDVAGMPDVRDQKVSRPKGAKDVSHPKEAERQRMIAKYLEVDPEAHLSGRAQGGGRGAENLSERTQRLTGKEDPLAEATQEQMNIAIGKRRLDLLNRAISHLDARIAVSD